MRIKNLIWVMMIILTFTIAARADVFFESATLNNTGSNGGGVAVSYVQSVGVRLQIVQDVQVTAIGGHFVQNRYNSGTFFGAILSLDSLSDLPTGNSSTTIANMSEVVGSTVFKGSYPSSDFRTPLSLELHPGYYALVFGTNALGASNGEGTMPILGQTAFANGRSTIAWPSFHSPTGLWHTAGADPDWPRFVIEGHVIPEPATLLLLGFGGLILRKRKPPPC